MSVLRSIARLSWQIVKWFFWMPFLWLFIKPIQFTIELTRQSFKTDGNDKGKFFLSRRSSRILFFLIFLAMMFSKNIDASTRVLFLMMIAPFALLWFYKKIKMGIATFSNNAFKTSRYDISSLSMNKMESQGIRIAFPAIDYKKLPRLDPPKGYVYLIQDTEISYRYKIGCTNHPKRRINRFDVKLPFKTEVIHVYAVTGYQEEESRLHRKFADKRKGGEWFDLDEKDVAYIKSLGK